MSKNNTDIGWEKPKGNGGNGSYDDSLIKNQISTLNNKINKVEEEIKAQLGELGKSMSIVILTQEDYDALEVKDDYTFYAIKED